MYISFKIQPAASFAFGESIQSELVIKLNHPWYV